MSETKERAIRRYLAFLEDPSTADRELMAELENQLSVAANPIEKLRVLAEIDGARSPDRRHLEDAFVLHAVEWAVENKIPTAAFLALGVDQSLLTKAGFTKGKGISAKARKSLLSQGGTSKSSRYAHDAGATGNGEVKIRAKSVNSETVEKLILATKGPFSVRDIVAVSEATNATVSRVVGILVAEKRVEKLGLLPPQGARGVAPQGYRVKVADPSKTKKKAG